MINKIRHKGLKALYQKNQTQGVHPDWVPRLRRILSLLEAANRPEDMNVAGYYLHALKGNYDGFWSVRVTGNWRVIWRFDGEDVTDVDLTDYH